MRSSRLNSTAKRLLVFFMSVTILLFGLEILFRLAHGVFSFAREAGIAQVAVGSKTSAVRRDFRIVSIGESTTAPAADQQGDMSWPRLLEGALQIEFDKLGKGVRVQVINLGRSAASSGFLVQAFENDFSKLRPDLVISMLGINDFHLFSVQHGFFYQNSYLVRFIFWSLRFVDCPTCFKNELAGVETANASVLRPLTISEQKLLEDLKSRVNSWYVGKPGEDEVLQSIAKMTRANDTLTIAAVQLHLAIHIFETFNSAYSKPGKLNPDDADWFIYRIASRLMEEGLPVAGSYYTYGLEYYCHIQSKLGDSCLELVLATIQNGAKPNAAVFTLLTYDRRSDDPRLQNLLRSYGWELDRSRSVLEMTRESYKKLESLLDYKRVPWIAMQYPTGRTEGIVAILKDDWKARFPPVSGARDFILFREAETVQTRQAPFFYVVSNENFSKKNKSQNVSSGYFRDYFARAQGLEFGHTNRSGAMLIVTNILDQMRPHWDEVLSAKDNR
jgi:hypothetical protein